LKKAISRFEFIKATSGNISSIGYNVKHTFLTIIYSPFTPPVTIKKKTYYSLMNLKV